MNKIVFLFTMFLINNTYAQSYPTPNTLPKIGGSLSIMPKEVIKSPKIDGDCKAIFYLESAHTVFLTVDALHGVGNFPEIKTANDFTILKPDIVWLSRTNKRELNEIAVEYTFKDKQNSLYEAIVEISSKEECKKEKDCYLYTGKINLNYHLQNALTIGNKIPGKTSIVQIKEYCPASEYEKKGLLQDPPSIVKSFFDFLKF